MKEHDHLKAVVSLFHQMFDQLQRQHNGTFMEWSQMKSTVIGHMHMLSRCYCRCSNTKPDHKALECTLMRTTLSPCFWRPLWWNTLFALFWRCLQGTAARGIITSRSLQGILPNDYFTTVLLTWPDWEMEWNVLHQMFLFPIALEACYLLLCHIP